MKNTLHHIINLKRRLLEDHLPKMLPMHCPSQAISNRIEGLMKMPQSDPPFTSYHRLNNKNERPPVRIESSRYL
ncbi:hypothetical protein V6N12_045563 [Hibiscus sabdariffa]|uniref:Uncharacterized protein n=1 Tax=Hibiscus sabdariffa TaxID=183260 RepID=A0ABR2G3L6_9ROSI